MINFVGTPPNFSEKLVTRCHGNHAFHLVQTELFLGTFIFSQPKKFVALICKVKMLKSFNP